MGLLIAKGKLKEHPQENVVALNKEQASILIRARVNRALMLSSLLLIGNQQYLANNPVYLRVQARQQEQRLSTQLPRSQWQTF